MRRTRIALTVGGAALVAGALTVPGAPRVSAATASGSCAAQIGIAVRASTEPQGGGSIAGPEVQAVQSQSRQQVAEYDLVYPATLDNYQSSESTGVRNLRTYLSQESSSCPQAKFFLVGYSQGSQVIADALAQSPVPAASKIEGAVLHGDPSFNGSESYDTGGYTPGVNGIFPRAKGALSTFASRLDSFCHVDDNLCQNGRSGNGHYTYAQNRQAGVTFLLGKIGG